MKFKNFPIKEINTKSKYSNGRTAIILIGKDGEDIAVGSVNVPDTKIEKDEVAVKDYSENEGMLNFLVLNNVVSKPIRFVHSGYVQIPVCKLI